MRRNAFLILLAIALGLAVLPSSAYAAASVYQFRGSSASATFLTLDSTGCISTWANVYLYESLSRTSGGNASGDAAISVYVSRFDECQYTYAGDWYGWATLPANAFSFGGALHSAEVTVALTLSDYCGNTIPASVDLTWAGVGETFRGTYSSSSMSQHYKSRYRSTGNYSDAQATGTLLFDSENLAATPSLWANLFSSHSGSVYNYNYD